MDPEKILRLLAKQMGKAASDSELAELKELLLQHPEHQSLPEMLNDIEAKKPGGEQATAEEELVRENWRKLRDSMSAAGAMEDVKRLGKTRRQWLQQAAIWTGIALLAGGSFLWWGHTEKQQAEKTGIAALKQVSLRHGAPEKTTLPDGSTVWLNAGRRIR